MKSAIAAFIAAAAAAIAAGETTGSLSLLITGDEEGDATHGTRAVVEALRAEGERIDHCVVGEPTSAAELGDMIKVGRRGSLNAEITVEGVQGHVAYPDRARQSRAGAGAAAGDAAGSAAGRGLSASSSRRTSKSPPSTSATRPPTSSRPRPRRG